MNRQIKFRGQRADTKEWVYGSLITTPTGIYIHPEGGELSFDLGSIEVILETVGQLTPWKDCWDNEIYEEDIIAYNGITLRVSFFDGKFCFYDKYAKAVLELPSHIISHFKIIGDMINNPQLIQ